MSIYQNKKSGKWYYKFVIEGIQYHKACKGINTYKEALECEIKAKNAILESNYDYLKKKKRITLKEAVELYLNYSKVNKRSYKLDINYTNQFLTYWGSNIYLSDLTPQKIEEFKSFMVKGRSNATVNRYIEAMSKMFNLCIDNNFIEFNPIKKVAKLKQNNHKTRVLSKEEQEHIFKILENEYPDLRDIIICALQTGLRRGEIFILKWCDINFKERYINAYRPKTNSYSKIFITDKLLEVFEKRKNNNSEYIFVNPNAHPMPDVKKQAFNILNDFL